MAGQPFTSGYIQTSDEVMEIFSSGGFNFETSDNFMPRSISLAEIKWVQDLTEGSSIRYGMGVRYLEQ